jgi:hypothetical protein
VVKASYLLVVEVGILLDQPFQEVVEVDLAFQVVEEACPYLVLREEVVAYAYSFIKEHPFLVEEEFLKVVLEPYQVDVVFRMEVLMACLVGEE